VKKLHEFGGSHPSSIFLAEIASISKIDVLKLAAAHFATSLGGAKSPKIHLYFAPLYIFHSPYPRRVNYHAVCGAPKTVPKGFKDFKQAKKMPFFLPWAKCPPSGSRLNEKIALDAPTSPGRLSSSLEIGDKMANAAKAIELFGKWRKRRR